MTTTIISSVIGGLIILLIVFSLKIAQLSHKLRLSDKENEDIRSKFKSLETKYSEINNANNDKMNRHYYVPRDVIPHLIRFLSSTRIYQFKNNCEVDITYKHLVKNDSKDNIEQLRIPFYFDYNQPESEDEKLSFIVRKLLINANEILNPED